MPDTPKPGRPPKLTPSAVAAVVRLVRRGCPRRVAADAAGVGRSTLQRWLARGRRERAGEFRDLWDAVKKAEAEAVVAGVAAVTAAAKQGTWQAAAWYLERRYPEEFGNDRRRIRELEKQVNELVGRVRAFARQMPPADVLPFPPAADNAV